jgi:hypothetical protein
MMQVWKFELKGTCSLFVPVGAKTLTVQVQKGVPCIWMLVDPKAAKEERFFRIYGTGHEMSEVGEYIGTFQIAGGTFVFHVFEHWFGNDK